MGLPFRRLADPTKRPPADAGGLRTGVRSAGALGADNQHGVGHAMKHATIGRRGKRCSTFRDYGGRVVGEPYPRNLAFSVTYNFRDVGGYPALDGKIVRWRRLFRADSLHRLEGDDWEA